MGVIGRVVVHIYQDGKAKIIIKKISSFEELITTITNISDISH